MIGDHIEVKILSIRGSGDQAVVRLGIVAPRELTVHRKEVYEAVVTENRLAARAEPDSLGDVMAALLRLGEAEIKVSQEPEPQQRRRKGRR